MKAADTKKSNSSLLVVSRSSFLRIDPLNSGELFFGEFAENSEGICVNRYSLLRQQSYFAGDVLSRLKWLINV